MPTYSIFNAINMSTYSVFRFINWRNLDFFTRLRQLITYFEASAISAARSSSLIPLRILSKSSVLLTVCGILSKYELYSCILGSGYAPMYFDVTSLLVLCAILLLIYSLGTPALFRFVAKLWRAQVEVGVCFSFNISATFFICLRILLLYLCITPPSCSGVFDLLKMGNTRSPSLGSLPNLSIIF